MPNEGWIGVAYGDGDVTAAVRVESLPCGLDELLGELLLV